MEQRHFLEHNDKKFAPQRTLSFPLLGIARIRDTLHHAGACWIFRLRGDDLRRLLSLHHRVSRVRSIRHTRRDFEAIP